MSIGVPFDRQIEPKPILARLQGLYSLGLGLLFLQFYASGVACLFLVWSAKSKYLSDRSFTESPSRALPGWLPQVNLFLSVGAFILILAIPIFFWAWRARPREGRLFLPLSLSASAPFAVMLLYIAAGICSLGMVGEIMSIGLL